MYSGNAVREVQLDPATPHGMEQSVYNLHGILRVREDAFVFLNNQSYPLILKPFHGVSVTPLAQKPLHEFVASGVYLLYAFYLFE
jgi:hypothetical protein